MEKNKKTLEFTGFQKVCAVVYKNGKINQNSIAKEINSTYSHVSNLINYGINNCIFQSTKLGREKKIELTEFGYGIGQMFYSIELELNKIKKGDDKQWEK